MKLGAKSATNCYGVVGGNTSNTEINAIAALGFGDAENWGDEIKDDNSGRPCERDRKLLRAQLDTLVESGTDGTVESVVC